MSVGPFGRHLIDCAESAVYLTSIFFPLMM